MNTENELSNEQINAYVDDQLSTEVRAEILNESQKNKALADSICQTRIIKEMVKLSYQQAPGQEHKKKTENAVSVCWQHGLAASLLLILGSVAGWQGANTVSRHYASNDVLPLQYTQKNQHHVLLHISTDEPSRVNAALNNAERLLNSNNQQDKFQLQILVNAEGIKILQEEQSPYIERLKKLASQHDNVSLLACQRSIERQKLKGLEVHLIKEASVIPEALEEIVNRLHQGWVYIRA